MQHTDSHTTLRIAGYSDTAGVQVHISSQGRHGQNAQPMSSKHAKLKGRMKWLRGIDGDLMLHAQI